MESNVLGGKEIKGRSRGGALTVKDHCKAQCSRLISQVQGRMDKSSLKSFMGHAAAARTNLKKRQCTVHMCRPMVKTERPDITILFLLLLCLPLSATLVLPHRLSVAFLECLLWVAHRSSLFPSDPLPNVVLPDSLITPITCHHKPWTRRRRCRCPDPTTIVALTLWIPTTSPPKLWIARTFRDWS
ncbi:uncharacterized protein CLUP02_03249 [Colletotrichum lupini]|uniref:Uncharacterized protein n=1 Tax=Colletotrichum lupini TaxID=145971 RepID=A0A9Q8SIJ6_9PEZI|nr:uncharacterized protein CLUP02_03249 [Colletotrichum lupini]UQC77778.1 hypothetical protein CLUP02_03249 [Colletotrichum lupini]